jgi:hypothetical protein
VTIGFWSNHARTGQYSVALRNAPGTQYYVAPYTHAVSNVWQWNTITVPGSTAGTWTADNTTSLALTFTAACGATQTAPTANIWAAGSAFYAAPGQINGVAATSDVHRIAGVVVLPGTEAPPAARAPLIMRPYDQELLTCQRYLYRRNFPVTASMVAVLQAYNATSANGHFFDFPTQMRAIPTVTASAAATFTCQGAAGGSLALTTLSLAPTVDAAMGQLACASGLVAGNAMALYVNQAAWLQFDARL